VAFTVGAAFTAIVQSLVADMLMPPIGLVLGQADFADLFLVLKEGNAAAPPYVTLQAAQAAGAVTLNYGLFLNKLVAFLLVSLSMFAIVRIVNRVHARLEAEFAARKPRGDEPVARKCPYCLTGIAPQATRCPACTSGLPGA